MDFNQFKKCVQCEPLQVSIWTLDRPSSTGPNWSNLNQWSPAQSADGDEGLTGSRVQPNGLHQTEVQEAESESTADVRQVMFTQQHPGHAHQEGPQVEQDPQGHLDDMTHNESEGKLTHQGPDPQNYLIQTCMNQNKN